MGSLHADQPPPVLFLVNDRELLWASVPPTHGNTTAHAAMAERKACVTGLLCAPLLPAAEEGLCYWPTVRAPAASTLIWGKPVFVGRGRTYTHSTRAPCWE